MPLKILVLYLKENCSMRVEKIAISKATIETVVRGSGDTIVLLPGLGFGAGQFDHFADLLVDAGFCTVAINPRGVAESEGPLNNLTLHDLAADVGEVIDALGATPAHVLGQAFGNRVARCLAADHPDLVSTVILIAAGGIAKPDTEAAFALRTMYRADASHEERLQAARTALLSPHSDPNLLPRVEVWPVAAASQLAANEATPIEEWWTAGRAPILLIQGLDDRIAPPGNGRTLQDRLEDRVCLIELPEAGHALLREQPLAVADAIIEFLHNTDVDSASF